MPRKIARYGWVKDLPDQRDLRYSSPPKVLKTIPPEIDLRQQCPPVYDQGELGSCTANAIAAAVEYERVKQKLSDFVPSRLFIYYNERVIEGTVDYDSGAQLRDGMKTVATQGACSESNWTYNIASFAIKPPSIAYSEALKDKVASYSSIKQTLNQFKGCLASGYPFVFGFSVYESFESDTVATTGHAPLPGSHEKLLGGHAVMAVRI